jgi:GH24 family phage-related lysozyme (muramidase)
MQWAFRECLDHYAFQLKHGQTTCMDCGHTWTTDEDADKCVCPKCKAKLEVQRTKRQKAMSSTYFRGFGRDSLLLATLAYNVGCGKVMKSRMYAKMRSGNRNIYRDYVDFKRWNGKIVPSIERRRKMEYLLLFTP